MGQPAPCPQYPHKRLGWVEILKYEAGECLVYLRRLYIIRLKRLFSIRLHHIRLTDKDRDPHDHPWFFISFPIKGWYREAWSHGGARNWMLDRRQRYVRLCSFHRNTDLHQIQEVSPGGVWTLIFTGPESRVWGFQTIDKWIPWTEYLDGS